MTRLRASISSGQLTFNGLCCFWNPSLWLDLEMNQKQLILTLRLDFNQLEMNPSAQFLNASHTYQERDWTFRITAHSAHLSANQKKGVCLLWYELLICIRPNECFASKVVKCSFRLETTVGNRIEVTEHFNQSLFDLWLDSHWVIDTLYAKR